MTTPVSEAGGASARPGPLVEELRPAPDPVRCCERLDGLPYRLFLDSAAQTTRLGRYSFLMADPALVVRSRGARVEIDDRRTGERTVTDGDVLTAVRRLVAPHTFAPVAEVPPFQGGAAGFIAYDWGLTLERLPEPRFDDLGLPDTLLGIYDWTLAWDHVSGRAWLISTGLPEMGNAREARARDRAAEVRARIDSGGSRQSAPGLKDKARPTLEARPTLPHFQPTGRERASSYVVGGGWWPASLELRSSFTHRGYLDAVQCVREYIVAGDIFQANLSQRFEAPFAESPWAYYRRLRARNAAPFAAFLDAPEAVVVSASPERFLRVDAHGHVETRPIKGTRPRGLGPEHDAALAQALAESAKDRAENLMIVDLMRNDLSRVCAPRSVRVSELFSLERYPTVHHLVSTVVGDLEGGHDGLDLLRAAFPGGSITGAPKLRAMEVIAELEPSRRGVYCGSIGYWSLSGDLDTNIAIRTALVQEGRVFFSAGGGIVADSDPESEYRETLDKARALIDALAQ
jgi:para-aminobenzoate synthetase component 1